VEHKRSFDRELAIIFGVAFGLMVIVVIVLCVLRKRSAKNHDKFLIGGDGIEIQTSKF